MGSVAKQKTYSLFLAKPSTIPDEDLLTENARARLVTAIKASAPNFGDGGELFIFPGADHPPKWLSEVKGVFNIKTTLLGKSHSAVVIFKQGNNRFALTYGYGHVMLDDAQFVSDFGLRTCINFVDDAGVKSVERSNLASAIRDLSQAASGRSFDSYGIDDVLEVIQRVSGASRSSSFAASASGARALKISKKISLEDVPETAEQAEKLYRSNAYKDTQFAVIDQLSPVTDPAICDHLDGELLKSLHNESNSFEISAPEIRATTVAYYNIRGARVFGHTDVSLDLYLKNVPGGAGGLDLDKLKRHRIEVYDHNGHQEIDGWSIYRALIGSLSIAGRRYAIHEGRWYQVDGSLKDAAEKAFEDRCVPLDPIFGPLVEKVSGEGKAAKRALESEYDYNRRTAAQADLICLDQELVKVPARPGRGIELCDILDVEKRRYIHIKKSSRQSSTLSHLFKQGRNAAAMVQGDADFRKNALDLVGDKYGDQDRKALESAWNDGSRWTVEFRIADIPRPNGSFNIPFFSKLTFREECRLLLPTHDVGIGFIKTGT